MAAYCEVNRIEFTVTKQRSYLRFARACQNEKKCQNDGLVSWVTHIPRHHCMEKTCHLITWQDAERSWRPSCMFCCSWFWMLIFFSLVKVDTGKALITACSPTAHVDNDTCSMASATGMKYNGINSNWLVAHDRISVSYRYLRNLHWRKVNLPSGSWGMPLKMMRYVVRKSAPSAGRMCGPPSRPPVASSLPSGSRSTLSPSVTNSSPGSSAGRRILG